MSDSSLTDSTLVDPSSIQDLRYELAHQTRIASESQQALADIIAILDNIHSGDEDLWFQIGRAIGTAKVAYLGKAGRS